MFPAAPGVHLPHHQIPAPPFLAGVDRGTNLGREGSQGGSLSASQMSGHKLGPVPSLQERLAWKAAASWQPE